MGKKSREKRVRRELDLWLERLAADFESSIVRDDPGYLREIVERYGRQGLFRLMPNVPIPFPVLLAQEKAARCLAAYVEIVAQEAKARIDEGGGDDSQAFRWLGDGFFALSTLALAFSKDGLPHPAKEIREAIASVFEHVGDVEGILGLLKERLHPLVQDDWAFVARERLADEEAEDLLRAIGDAGLPKEGGPEAEKEPGGL